MELNELLSSLDAPMRLKIVVLSGAGISAESGLATFRDKDGAWNRYDPEKVSSIEGFREDPQAVLDFYNMRRKELLGVEPNLAHRLIGMISEYHDVSVVTQNIDDLHERGGAPEVVHLHGELKKVTSSRRRFDPQMIKEYPLDRPINLGDTADDGTQLRPYIVWFGEELNPKDMERAYELVTAADICLVVGTSLQVYPAAGFVRYARKNALKYIIDPADLSDRIPAGFTHIKARATEGMVTFVEELGERFYKGL